MKVKKNIEFKLKVMSFEEKCLDTYFSDDCEIISTSTKIEHDGYDAYGPESNLYDFAVLFLKDNKIYYAEFHREYWFCGEDDEEYRLCYSKDIFDRCISDELKNEGYYSSKDVLDLIRILNEEFTELVVEKILEKVVKTSYLPNMLSLKKDDNNTELINLTNYNGFKLYLK